MKNQLLKQLPKMDELLLDEAVVSQIQISGRVIVIEALRQVIESKREAILAGDEKVPDKQELVEAAIHLAKKNAQMNLRPVINATGTVLHTNLGRARLSKKAWEAVLDVSKSYSNLEYNLATGKRGERYDNITDLLVKLTGAESALVVNNNAAAVLLALSGLAKNKRVIVSRGEQVEIGGMFRVPDIMEQSGSIMMEVGTTNKTHLADYEREIDDESVLLKIHTSNYKIIGFTEDVELSRLAELGKQKNVPVIYDLGSGSLIDFEVYGILDEPSVKKSVADGANLICFSGDKLLGGPQAGIIIGDKKYIDILKKHPLTRAFRIDKMTLAALEATLREYMDEKQAIQNIPVLRQIIGDKKQLEEKANIMFNRISQQCPALTAKVIAESGTIGGGSMPGYFIDTYCVAISSDKISPNEIEEALRACPVPIIARIAKDSLLIDVLTIDEDDLDYVADSIINCAGDSLLQGVKR